jgi:AbrB family looped-hinge helix DNA binding protein
LSKSSRREILGMSTITYKFQVTIPKKVREKFGYEKGDILVFVEEDGKLVIKKSTEY